MTVLVPAPADELAIDSDGTDVGGTSGYLWQTWALWIELGRVRNAGDCGWMHDIGRAGTW